MKITMKLFAAYLLLFLSACSTSKKTVHKEEINRDSIFQKQIDSLLQVQKETVIIYEKKWEEARKNKVEFDNPCPTMPNIDSSCNKDSLVQVIRAQDQLLQSMDNEVRLNADGSINAKGRIKYLNTEWTRSEQEKSFWQQKYDSLNKVHSEEKVQVVERVVTKDKQVTRWQLSLLFILIAFVAGCFFWNWKGNTLKQFFGKISIY